MVLRAANLVVREANGSSGTLVKNPILFVIAWLVPAAGLLLIITRSGS